jgi:hypothetical protein
MSTVTFSKRSENLATRAGGLIVLLGALVLAGWAFDLTALKSVVPGWRTMAPLTAVALVVSGMALWVAAASAAPHRSAPQGRGHRLGQGLAGVVALMAALRLCDYLMGWNLGIDRLGFPESPADLGMTAATSMAPATALGLLFVSCALLLPKRPAFNTAFQSLTWLSGLLGWLGFSFYLYGGKPLLPFAQMAVHTAIAFLILSVGILCTRTDVGLLALLTSNSAAGSVTRRLAGGAGRPNASGLAVRNGTEGRVVRRCSRNGTACTCHYHLPWRPGLAHRQAAEYLRYSTEHSAGRFD